MFARKNISFEEAVLETTLLPIFINYSLIVTLVIRDQVLIKAFSFIKKYPGYFEHPRRLRVLPILSHKKVTTILDILRGF